MTAPQSQQTREQTQKELEFFLNEIDFCVPPPQSTVTGITDNMRARNIVERAFDAGITYGKKKSKDLAQARQQWVKEVREGIEGSGYVGDELTIEDILALPSLSLTEPKEEK